jgi:hypothetical protein
MRLFEHVFCGSSPTSAFLRSTWHRRYIYHHGLHGSDAHGLDGIERRNWLAIDTTIELPLRIGPRSRDVLAENWAACPSERAGHGYLFLFILPFIRWGR